MTVTIDGNPLIHIIDTNFVEISQVSVPDWINENPELDTNIWSKKPFSIVYIARVTDAIKWALDQLLVAHNSITLIDTIYSINDSVWIRSINARWEGNIDYTSPWLLEIELIVIPPPPAFVMSSVQPFGGSCPLGNSYQRRAFYIDEYYYIFQNYWRII